MTARSRAARLAGAIGLSSLLVVLVACAPGEAGQTPATPSGVRGSVLICPGPPDPEATAEPCTTPYRAQLAILDGDSNLVTRVTSGDDGRFQIDLAPGEYTLAPRNGDPYPTAPSQPVIVVAGLYTEIQVNYDSGSR